MSVDVNYYSFSPSRADKNWANFIEDLLVLRKKHAPWKEHEKDSRIYVERRLEIEASFEPKISAVRKKIFDHFSNKGFIIPWIEWDEDVGTDQYGNPVTMSDEDKMEYLKVYGCVYPRGSDIKDKGVPYLMLSTDATELEKSYDEIINERDEALYKPTEHGTAAPTEDKSVILNERQKKLDEEAGISYLSYEDIFNPAQLILDLKYLDIYYGSIKNDYFENPKAEYDLLEIFMNLLNLKSENSVPSRKDWIRLFKDMNNEMIQMASDSIMKAIGWDKDESEYAVIDYLKSVKPVIKDLNETPDAVFLRIYGGIDEAEPKSVELMLLERAQKHAIKYKGLLAPVL